MSLRRLKRRHQGLIAQRWAGRWALRRFCRAYIATLPRVSPSTD